MQADPDATRGQSRAAQFFNDVARADGVVDGMDDAVDYVSFTYSETKSVTLELTGGADVSELHRDIDMVLENSRGPYHCAQRRTREDTRVH